MTTNPLPPTQPNPGHPALPPSPFGIPHPHHRHLSKISRLPRTLRNLINHLLDDGATYSQIVQRLNQSSDPPLPFPISQRNLSDWHSTGFQDWLRHQEHLQLLASRLDFALELANHTLPDQLHDFALQLASLRLCEALIQSPIPDPQNSLDTYLRLLSLLPRLTKEALNLRKCHGTSPKPITPQPASTAATLAASKTPDPAVAVPPSERAEPVLHRSSPPPTPLPALRPIPSTPSPARQVPVAAEHVPILGRLTGNGNLRKPSPMLSTDLPSPPVLPGAGPLEQTTPLRGPVTRARPLKTPRSAQELTFHEL